MPPTSSEVTVVVVDRAPASARPVVDALSTDARRIRVETNVDAAVSAVVTADPDCVVAGHDGDDLDGLETLRRVRDANPGVPVVLFPEGGEEATASAAVAAGVTDYVPRASDGGRRGGLDDLVDSVAAVVDGTAPEAEPPSDPRERRHRQGDALVDLATDEAVTRGDFQTAVRRIAETAADVVGVSRVNVWLFDDDGDVLRCVADYDRRTGEHGDGAELTAERYPTYFGALRERRTIEVVDALADPRTEELGAYLREHDVGALLDGTLRFEGEVVGVVCHEHTGGPRRWTAGEVGFAGNVADLVHRALRNRESARRRERLEFRESLLTAQQEATPGGVLVVDDDGRIVSHDERLRELWGLSEGALSGDCEPVLSTIRSQVVAPGPTAESPLTTEEGTARAELDLDDGRVVGAYTAPVVGEDGHRYGRIWRFRDVTERHELDGEHERKHRAIEAAPVGITVAAVDGDDNPLVYANERFESLTGYDWPDVEGRDCRFLQGPETEPDPVAELQAAIDEERSTTVELRNYRADGTEFWNRVTVAPIRDGDGAVDHFVGFQEDVTERKRRERDLRESERRFQAIFDDPNILVGLLAPDGEVIDVNTTALRFVPESREELLGTPFAETPWFAGDDALQVEVRELIERAADGEYAAFEFDHTTAVGEELIAAGVIRPVTDDGRVVSLLVSARDVTDRTRRDRQLDALDRVLRHNLHNEMNVVLGNAQSIAETGSDEVADMADAIVESGSRLLDITAKQRRIVRLLSEAPEASEQDLSVTLGASLAEIRERYPGAEVAVDAPDGLAVRAVPQLEAALVELVENAVVHGAAPVTVEVAATEETVQVRVADRGPGIHTEEQAILLGEGERGPLYHGNGMGLWLVNWVVTFSEGTVDYADRDPQGAVVEVTLQRADSG